VAEHRVAIRQSSLDDGGWNLGSETEQQLLAKIKAAGIPLGEYVKGKIYRGVLTGLNEAFVIDAATRDRLIAEGPRSAEVIKPFLAGRDIKRYQEPKSNKFLILFPKGFTDKMRNNKGYPWKWLQDNYPVVSNYLEPFEKAAKKRCDKGDYWWELRACDYYQEFEKQKILFAEISTIGQFTIDDTNYYSDTTSYILGSYDKYLLSILNSNVCSYFFSKISSSIRGGFFRWKRQYVELIPIKIIDNCNLSETSLHATIIANVDLMLQLNKDLQAATLPDRKEQLKARIGHTDEKINRMVYQLYGLTAEEIQIVENFR
jgi:hypothetical protein